MSGSVSLIDGHIDEVNTDKTCKDCIHYDVCWQRIEIDNGNFMLGCIGNCNKFKDKSRFVELPCKVGDTVYEIVEQSDGITRILKMTVGKVIPFGDYYKSSVEEYSKLWNLYLFDKYSYSYKSFYDFGKTVFLTKEEAEAKLKEWQNEKNNF